MKEIGLLNREISDAVTKMGHEDELCICDAGFSIPLNIRDIDISLKDNKPGLMEVLKEILKYLSVEKVVIAKETKNVNPTMFNDIVKLLDEGVDIKIIPHLKLKRRCKDVKAIIRTGEFIAYSNLILISVADEGRWIIENK